MNLTITDTDSGRHYWTANQCADHCGISRRTWTSYAGRGQCPSPAGKFDRLTIWDADEVRVWHAGRPFPHRAN